VTAALARAIELAESTVPDLTLAPVGPVGSVAQTLIAAVDLDRTLIYSAAALALDGPDADAPDLVVAEVYDGAPLSFMTARSVAILNGFCEIALLVPTTTRTRAQYARVRVPGRPHQYAVTGNGAHLLVDGEPDPDWSAEVARLVAAQSAPLAEVVAHLAETFLDEFTRTRKVAEGVFAYAVLHRRDLLPPDLVPALTDWCAPRGWAVSLQGRKIYCVPRSLTKTAAVAEVARRAAATTVVASGDSLLDGVLMDAADEGIRPAQACQRTRTVTTGGIVDAGRSSHIAHSQRAAIS